MSQTVKSGLGLFGIVAIVLAAAIGLLGGARQDAPAQTVLAAPLVITPSAEPPTLTPTPTDTPVPPTLTPTNTPVPPTLTPTPTNTPAAPPLTTTSTPAPTATRSVESVVTSTPTPTLPPPLLPPTGSSRAYPAVDLSVLGSILIGLGVVVIWSLWRRVRRASP